MTKSPNRINFDLSFDIFIHYINKYFKTIPDGKPFSRTNELIKTTASKSCIIRLLPPKFPFPFRQTEESFKNEREVLWLWGQRSFSQNVTLKWKAGPALLGLIFAWMKYIKKLEINFWEVSLYKVFSISQTVEIRRLNKCYVYFIIWQGHNIILFILNFNWTTL